MKTTKLSELKDYEGIDASIEISLYEYGLLCKKEEDNINVIFGTGADESGNYNLFSSSSITEEELNNIIHESWFDLPSFLSCCGMTEKSWLSLYHTSKLSDLLSYYGSENILGSSYFNFEIENDL